MVLAGKDRRGTQTADVELRSVRRLVKNLDTVGGMNGPHGGMQLEPAVLRNSELGRSGNDARTVNPGEGRGILRNADLREARGGREQHQHGDHHGRGRAQMVQ
jgi:hypothetical protein